MISCYPRAPLFSVLLILWFTLAHPLGVASKPAPDAPRDLLMPPAATTAESIDLMWSKPLGGLKPIRYVIFDGGKEFAQTEKTNVTISHLAPSSTHRFTVKGQLATGEWTGASAALTVKTKAASALFDVTQFGAKGDGKTSDTAAIQQAITACTSGGTVYLPAGNYLSGALFLKSDMTLLLDRDCVLRGSENPKEYEPLIRNRFEGWEMDTYASLLNAGRLDHAGGANVHDISIRGAGKIIGGGKVLAEEMIASRGIRSRGRLFCIMNCSGLNVQGLTLEESPSWTVHFIYSEKISLHDLTIRSTTRNGDGIDPDSSRDCYIFNCSFATNDDCIAIKSGKNPEGFKIGRVTENIFISECNFVQGHGISIGSEISGGVRNVVIRDCQAGNLIHGLQIKATKDRGAFVEHVEVKDCRLQKIRVLTKLSYNNDGEAAPEPPRFAHFVFRDLDMSQAEDKDAAIIVNGFDEGAHRTTDVRLENIALPPQAKVMFDEVKSVQLINVRTKTGEAPSMKVERSEDVTVDGHDVTARGRRS